MIIRLYDLINYFELEHAFVTLIFIGLAIALSLGDKFPSKP